MDEHSQSTEPDPARARRGGGAAHLALLAVQLGFSTLPLAAKYYVLPSLPAASLVGIRVVVAAAVLVAIVRTTGRRRIERRSDLWRLAFYAALGVAANQLLFIGGLAHTTPVNAQLISTTIPAFTLMFGVLLGSERLAPTRVAGIVVAAAGVVYLVGPDRAQLTPDTTLGNAMITANALAYSLYLVLVRRVLAREDSLTVIAYVFLFGALMVAPFGAVSLIRSGPLSDVPLRAWAGLAFIIAVPTIGSYWLSAWALARASASVVASYIYLQPFLTAVIAVVCFGEALDARALPSAVFIFVGVAMATRAQGRRDAGA